MFQHKTRVSCARLEKTYVVIFPAYYMHILKIIEFSLRIYMNFNRKGPCDTLKLGRIFYFRFNYFCTRLCTLPVFWLKADKTQYHQTVMVIRDTLLNTYSNSR